jgi:RimJ/RimL family protein N-acetyltransferase
MHPYLTQRLATERRERFLREADQSRLARSAKRDSKTPLRFRALEPVDIHRIADLYAGLSPRSRFLRFMAPIPELSNRVLEHLANIDHDHHAAIGVFDRDGLVGSAHWFRMEGTPRQAEFAIEVTDHYQRRGVGSRLLHLLAHRARTQGIEVFGATVLAENTGAIALIRASGWPFAWTYDGPQLSLTMAIDGKVGT